MNTHPTTARNETPLATPRREPLAPRYPRLGELGSLCDTLRDLQYRAEVAVHLYETGDPQRRNCGPDMIGAERAYRVLSVCNAMLAAHDKALFALPLPWGLPQ